MLTLSLPDGAYDIIGDVHGEFDALLHLVQHLGYDTVGRHPEGRRLLFLGDLIDRGMRSPSVLRWVRKAVHHGYAHALCGNHELNLINNEYRSGAGWWWHDHYAKERRIYGDVECILNYERSDIIHFLKSLPIAIEAPGFRAVHAQWDAAALTTIQSLSFDDYDCYHERIIDDFHQLRESYLAERRIYQHDIYDEYGIPPLLPAAQAYLPLYQNQHPFRVLTSGHEQPSDMPFFASGQWRVTSRAPWWEHYLDDMPLFIGHYWRHWSGQHHEIFGDLEPTSWIGPKKNVFCCDFSVGRRYQLRKGHIGHTALAAVRFPEYELVSDHGLRYPLQKPGYNYDSYLQK